MTALQAPPTSGLQASCVSCRQVRTVCEWSPDEPQVVEACTHARTPVPEQTFDKKSIDGLDDPCEDVGMTNTNTPEWSDVVADAWVTITCETWLAATPSDPQSVPIEHTYAVVIDGDASVSTWHDGDIIRRVPWVPGVEISAVHDVMSWAGRGTLAGPGGYPIQQRPVRSVVGGHVDIATDDPWDTWEQRTMARVYDEAARCAHDYYDVGGDE